MHEFGYTVQGFLTVRRDSVRIPLSGSLGIHTDPDSGLFSGDLVLRESIIERKVLDASLFRGTVQITAGSPVIGRIGHDGQLFAVATVEAVITGGHAAGRTWLSNGSCRTASQAIVPLRSRPGFSLERGGRVAGRYYRPPFTGCGWLTPIVNLLATGSGNAAVIDLVPVTPAA